MPIDHDPPGLDELDEGDRTKEVFAWAGLALYNAQVLEHGMVNLLFAAGLPQSSYPVQGSDVDFHDVHFRLVVGELVKKIRATVDVSDDLDARLDDARLTRNRLVHHFFRERAELFMTVEGKRIMLQELHQMFNIFFDLDKELQRIMFELGSRHGLTEATVEQVYEKMRQDLEEP